MKIRDRIKSLRRVKPSDLRPNPRNWRTHPEAQQDALRGVLADIGIAGAVIARELPDGSLELIDGHLRAETIADQEIPVLVLDVTEEEASTLLATMDPVGALAEADAAKLGPLLEEIGEQCESVQAMLDGMTGEAESSESIELKQLSTMQPPAMTWALVGLPTVRWGEVAEMFEVIAKLNGVILETTSNDG